MGKKLVVVESPTKAKTIGKILGSGYVIKSSMGHVRDLPVKTLGVDVEKNFKPTYVVVPGRKKLVDELKKAAADADGIYLAPDPDREGEAIAWHLQHVLQSVAKGTEFFRIQYNEITPRAVREAFDKPSKIEINRVNAQQARRVLDRIVGYKVSPMLWRRLRRGLSAGRVQSVALRLVCEREKEIRDFVPEVFWIIGAKVRKFVEPRDPFTIRLVKIDGKKAEIKSAEGAGAIREDLEGRDLVVAGTDHKDVTKRPLPPFITSTLQQAGSSAFGFSPARTMSIAQKLYEGVNLGDGPIGLITYMRTDSFSISRDAIEACRAHIKNQYGEEYCPEKPNFYKSRSGAQEAHEAIRPTDINRTPENMAKYLDPAGLKLYKLIWQRFVASQMMPAKLHLRTVRIVVNSDKTGHEYLFQATATEVKFPGYMKVTGTERATGSSQDKADGVVPELQDGEKVECLEWKDERKETQPPSRFSEATLIRALESNGIGRPSTYATIIATLVNRAYVSKDKKALVPTQLGEDVNALLVSSLAELFDVKFTAAMEQSLDEIENGTVDWTKMLSEFYSRFSGWMEAVKEPLADPVFLESVLTAMSEIKDWIPPVEGSRFGDKKFFDSVQKQKADGKKGITLRQLEALIHVAVRYKDTAPSLTGLIDKAFAEGIAKKEEAGPPSEATLKKMEALKGVELTESAAKFVASLKRRVDGGRRLSVAQISALDNVINSHVAIIPQYDAIKDLVGGSQDAQTVDEESGRMIQALSFVKEWKAPVKRGKRTFDDKVFYESLAGQYERKKNLSDKQKAALAKMLKRYAGQLPSEYMPAEEKNAE